MKLRQASIILPVLIVQNASTFCRGFDMIGTRRSIPRAFNSNDVLVLNSSNDSDNDMEEDDDIGTMRISEMKSELKLRQVDFSDCFDKESLSRKLREARASGKADPTIIDQFNKQSTDKDILNNPPDLDEEIIAKATSGDGTLPGGMPPDMLKSLVSNPELMELMQNPKMQEVMKMMMSGGQESIEKAMEEDKEVYEIVTKLNSVLADSI